MNEYRISCNMDASEIMGCLSESEEADFVYECYVYLGVFQKKDFIEMLDAEEVIKFLDDGEIVEHLSDEDLIEELELRGYIITKEIAK